MATKGLIVLDIGVLMSSRSPQVFHEMLDIYPGAKRIYEVLANMPACACGDPICPQNVFQTLITQASNNDRELSAKFIEFVDQADHLSFEILRDLQIDFYHKNIADKQPLRNSVIGGGDLFERIAQMVVVPRLGPNTSTDSVDNDEPEHGGSSEE